MKILNLRVKSQKARKIAAESRHLPKITVFTVVAENHSFRDFRDFVIIY